jgi:gliding motility-associated-like protein
MKILILLSALFTSLFLCAQNNDCGEQLIGCSTPAFPITANQGNNTIVDFTPGSGSCPSTPSAAISPNGFGCMATGEDNSTFIIITVTTTGTLSFTLGASGGSGFFDWILWPYNGPGTCAGLQNGTVAPVSCNWNASNSGFTGLAPTNALPAGGVAGNFNPPINAIAGTQYLLCFNNYSDITGNVPFNFTGTAQISCTGLAAIDQTICEGSSANINIIATGFVNPTFQYLVTNGVANPNAGPANIITPTVTTNYTVRVCSLGNCENVSFTITVVPKPIADAGLDVTTCFGSPYQLQGTSTGGAAPSHSWTQIPNPGFTPPATSTYAPNASSWIPNITTNTATTYKYVLSVSNPSCAADKDTVNVTFQKVELTATKTDPLCGLAADGTITITSALGAEYSKDNGVTWQPSNIFTGLLAGTYNMCSKSALGCKSCISVTLLDPIPVMVSVSPDITICENGSTTMVATGANGTSFTYNWSHTPNTNANQLISPLGTATYTVTATNQNNCTSLPLPIIVTVLPPITGTISPTQFICPGYFASVSATGIGGNGGPYSYTWSDAQVGSSVYVTNVGDQMYSVSIEDNCETTPLILQVLVKVNPLPVPLFVATDSTICEDAIFELTNLTDPLTMSSYVWNFSHGETFSNVPTVQTLPLENGNYDVQLIVTSPLGCIDSLKKSAYLISYKLPDAEFNWNPSPATMFNTEINLVNLSGANTINSWSIPLGSPSQSSLQNPVVKYPDGIVANYDVELIVTSAFGCKDTVQHVIQILPEVLFYAPSAFSPNNDEHNQNWNFSADGLDITSFNLFIANRWGQVIFESLDIKQGWDGTYNGKPAEQGTYNWVATARDRLNDKRYEFKGSIVLIK